MLFEKINEKEIIRMDVDEKSGKPNGKLYNYIIFGKKNIVVPDGVKEICYGAFAFYQKSDDEFEAIDTKLESIEIPASVEFVESGAFGFLNLQEVKVADGCKAIKVEKNAVFSGDGKRFLYKIYDDAFYYAVPDGVEEIGNEAFASNSMDIDLPDSVTVIREGAFAQFWGTVTIPKSVRLIEKNAFDKKKPKKVMQGVMKVKRGSYASRWARKNKVRRKFYK